MTFSTKNIAKGLNVENMWKTQKPLEAEPCTQSTFHKKIGISGQ